MSRHRLKPLMLFIGVLLLLSAGGVGLLGWAQAQQRYYMLARQLIAALVYRDDRLALVLVKAGADPNTRYEPMPPPTLQKLWDQLLHRSPIPVNKSPTALMLVCGAKWDDELETRMQQDFRPDAPEILEAMLKHNADVNARDESGKTALFWAIKGRRDHMVAVLLAHGADVNAKDDTGFTPLIAALELHVSWETLRLLFQHKVEVKAQDQETGRTPMIAAIRSDYPPDVIEALLTRGADVNAGDLSGNGPLMHAAEERSSPEVVRLLLKYGANVNAKNLGGDTPLMTVSTEVGDKYPIDPEFIRLLLEHGADPNVKDGFGTTPLQSVIACRAPTALVRAFIEYGADVNTEDRDGDTPLKLARSQRHFDLIALLRHAGARK